MATNIEHHAKVAANKPAPRAETAPLIEDHAMIGDLRTAALVTKDGSIDWLCLPAFDSDACFAALVGNSSNGRWKIAPTIPIKEVRRRYRKDTLILETELVTDAGTVMLVDFMPPRLGREHSVVCRRIVGVSGSVPMRSDLLPRFAFGRAVPRVVALDSVTQMFAGPDALYLHGGPGDGGRAPDLVAEFTVATGEEVAYSLGYGLAYEERPRIEDVALAERATEAFWTRWCSTLHVPPEFRDVVVRSLITIKSCIYEPTGGIVAAPTSSLPETPGGVRNWDYRFCWLRDGALALRSLILAGLKDEGHAFVDWALRAIAGDPAQVQIMYGLRGERRLSEVELPWLDGYEGARPVRVGNGAYDQRQLDVYGEVATVIYDASRKFKMGNAGVRALLNIARHVAANWQLPDRSLWEMRGPERSFTSSKVAAWVALDRAIRAIEERGVAEPIDELRVVRQAIFDEVCREGWNAELNTFTQYYGGTSLDASLLFIAMSGFLPATDPRVIGTVEAIERELLKDGFVLRYKIEPGLDGLAGDEEGVFLACSFWLAAVYHMMGREDDARRMFDRVAGTANDLGLLAEEYDPKLKRQLGNFPQAFSHFALVSAAFILSGVAPTGVSVH